MQLLINGRFLSQRITGVQRFALEVTKALDELLSKDRHRGVFKDARLLIPKNVSAVPDLKNIAVDVVGKRTGHAWEQWDLPLAVGGDLLVSLCQIGSLAAKRQLVVMHDASVYGVPFAFSRTFRLWYKILMPLLARRSHRVLTVSEFSKRELMRYCGVKEEKLRVIPEGKEHVLQVPADPSLIERHGLRGQRFVLAVSSVNPNKNFQAVVKAVDLLDGIDCKVVVAGGTDPRVFRGGQALPDRVIHLGYVSDAQLRALYESATAFIYPSFYEGFGLPPLEAMALGCPVIVSRRASMPEVCGDAALYCDPERPDEIAASIRRLVADPGLRDALAQAGKSRADAYTWKRSALALLNVAEEVAVELGQKRAAVLSSVEE